MAQPSTYDEQWTNRIGDSHLRFRMRVRPVVLGQWLLRPTNHKVNPSLVYWAMCPVPDNRIKEGISYRTVWLAFREPPELHIDREYHDCEAVVVNYEPILDDVIIPGFCFSGTVDGQTPVVKIEVLK